MPNNSISFDRAAGYYDQTRGFPAGEAAPIAELIARTGNLGPDSRVLEIGVGTGRIALPLSRLVGSYFGVDLSRAMMRRLREKQGNEAIHLAQADATRLPFARDAFDAVVAVHVFHLIPDWRRTLNEIIRGLRPGGVLLNCWNEVPDNTRMKRLWDAWNNALPSRQREPVGVRRSARGTFLQDEGWRQVDERVHRFQNTRSLQEHLDRLRRRVWSSLWSVSDDDLKTGIAAVEAAIAEQFDDPNAEIKGEVHFCAQAYLPPE